MKVGRPIGWTAIFPTVGIVLTAVGALFALRAADRASLDQGRADLASIAEHRARAVEAWVERGRATARLAALYPTVRYLAAGRDDDPRPYPIDEGAPRHLAGLLRDLVREHHHDGAVLIAADGRILASTADAGAEVDAEGVERDRALARDVIAAGRTAVHVETAPQDVPPRVPEDTPQDMPSEVTVRFAAPVSSDAGPLGIGVIVVRERTGRRLDRLLASSVERETLVLHAEDGPRPVRIPVGTARDQTPPTWVRAASSRVDVMEAAGEDGETALIATARLDAVPWVLEVRVPRARVVGGGRRWVFFGSAAAGLTVVGLGLALSSRRARRLATAQAELLQWTERLGQALDEGDDLVLFADGEGVVREARGAAAEFYGCDPAVLVGRRVGELGVDVPVPSIPAGGTLRVDTTLRRIDGVEVAVEIAMQRVGVGTPQTAVLVHVRDARRRRAAEERIRFLHRLLKLRSVLSHTLRDATSRGEVFDAVTRAAAEVGGFPLAWVGEARPDGRVASVSVAGANPEMVARLAGLWTGPRDALGPDGRAIVEQRTVLWSDATGAPSPEFMARARTLGVHSTVAAPIGQTAGRAEGVVVLHADEVVPADGEVIAVAEAVAADVAGALDRLAAREREREANERLLAVDASYHLLFDAHPWPMWVYDVATLRLLRVNETTSRVYGWDREALLQKTALDLRPPDEREATRAFFAACPPGSGYSVRVRHIRHDGTRFPVKVVATPIEFLGRPARLVLAEDLTERHRAEEATRILVRAVEQSPVSIVITDRDGAIEYVNPNFQRVTGYTLDEVRGRNPRLLKSDETPPTVHEALWRTISAGGTWRGELVNRRKDGTTFVELATVAPVQDSAGVITHYVAVKEDLTDRHAMEARAQSAEEKFLQAQKLEAVGRLAGGVAHDFNNLLCVILGYAQMVASGLGDAHPEADRLQQVLAAGKRAEGLTRQLLAFSRRQVLQPRVVDLHEVLRGIEKLLRRLIGEDVELVIDLRADAPVVRVDPGQLEQVVVNLAVNARDAMPRGGRMVISTEARMSDGTQVLAGEAVAAGPWVVLSVEDNGSGIDEVTQSHIFEPFFTTKPAGQGTGLGLATVHGIVRQSGGHVGFTSRLGEGSRFEVWLPLLAEAGQSALVDDRIDLEALRGSETVLLVEDQHAVRDLVRTWLEAFGYAVLDASDGEEALARADHVGRTVDLLLTDVVMPKMGGRELADRLKERWPGLRVVYMSGYPSDVLSRQGVLEAGVLLVEKPLAQASLLRVIRSALSGPA